MLLPQSAAFGYLKNRLNSVSPLGYLSMPLPGQRAAATGGGGAAGQGAPAFERAGRLKPAVGGRDDGSAGVKVPWGELLERFRAVQEKARRVRQGGVFAAGANEEGDTTQDGQKKALPGVRGGGSRPVSAGDVGGGPAGNAGKMAALAGKWEGQALGQGQGSAGQGTGQGDAAAVKDAKEQGHRSRFSASHLGRSLVSHARSAGSVGGGGAKGKDRN